jgi:plastocyanin
MIGRFLKDADMRIRCVDIAAVLASTLTLAACSRSTTTANVSSSVTPTVVAAATITLGASNFLQTSETISAGQALRLVDPASTGGIHKLCLGTDGQCDANAPDPTALLSPGLSVTPGTTQVITFLHAGSYQVTCTIHPSMQLTISVLGTG